MPSSLSKKFVWASLVYLGEFVCTSWLFFTNNHAIIREKKDTRGREKVWETQEVKKKVESRARALQCCDRESRPSSFLMLILCSTQWIISFSQGLDVIFVPLCISFDIIYVWIFSTHYWWFHFVRNAWFYLITSFMKLDFKFDWKVLLEFELNDFTLYVTLLET